MTARGTVSQMDVRHLALIRQSVEDFMRHVAAQYARTAGILLDIAPQDHAGARPFFPQEIVVETLDINPQAGARYTADLCDCRSVVPDCRFDYVVCTEVLEHTRQPFKAVDSIFRVLKPGGYCFVSTPFNFRIHGPLPDCWRFTEHGLKELFSRFSITELTSLDDPERFLMPLHYRLVARRPIA
jgi:SAM-dependent methyltransferase